MVDCSCCQQLPRPFSRCICLVFVGAAAAGFNLVEIPAFNADKLDVAMTNRVFAEHGVKAACSLGLSLGADISSDDSTVVQQGAAELDKALTFAAAIGAQHLCGILYSALAKYPRPPTAAGRQNAVRKLKVLADKAADKGVEVCLEVVNRLVMTTLYPRPFATQSYVQLISLFRMTTRA